MRCFNFVILFFWTIAFSFRSSCVLSLHFIFLFYFVNNKNSIDIGIQLFYRSYVFISCFFIKLKITTKRITFFWLLYVLFTYIHLSAKITKKWVSTICWKKQNTSTLVMFSKTSFCIFSEMKSFGKVQKGGRRSQRVEKIQEVVKWIYRTFSLNYFSKHYLQLVPENHLKLAKIYCPNPEITKIWLKINILVKI